MFQIGLSYHNPNTYLRFSHMRICTHVLKLTTQSRRWFTYSRNNLVSTTIGKLQYLLFTRHTPWYSFAVNQLSQLMQSPNLEHLNAVKMVLRYLKASSTSCLQISSHSDSNLYIYVDAKWAGDPCDRISTFGCILFLGQIRPVGPLRSNNQLLVPLLKQNTIGSQCTLWTYL